MVKESFFPFQVYPRVPGHEVVGDVVAIGEGEKLWKVGDRVGAGWHGGHCSSCTRCRIGDFVTCNISVTCPTGEYITRKQEIEAYSTIFIPKAWAETEGMRSTRL